MNRSPSFSHSSFHMFVLFKINDRSSGVESCVKEKAKYSTLTCGLKCWFSWFGSLSKIMMDSRNILISFTLFCYSKVVSFKIYRLFCENCCCKFTTHYIMIENQRPHISWWCCYIYISYSALTWCAGDAWKQKGNYYSCEPSHHDRAKLSAKISTTHSWLLFYFCPTYIYAQYFSKPWTFDNLRVQASV